MNNDDDLCYHLNAQDRIVHVSKSWDSFAIANDAADLTAEHICGRSLWDFITDTSTRQLYEQLLNRVRQGRVAVFNLRCDSPTCRRFLEMTIRPGPDQIVEFSTRTLMVEVRAAVRLLARDAARSTAMIRICAWCNRIPVAPGIWDEIENAIPHLRLFERDGLPTLTHSMCEDCHAVMLETVNDLAKS